MDLGKPGRPHAPIRNRTADQRGRTRTCTADQRNRSQTRHHRAGCHPAPSPPPFPGGSDSHAPRPQTGPNPRTRPPAATEPAEQATQLDHGLPQQVSRTRPHHSDAADRGPLDQRVRNWTPSTPARGPNSRTGSNLSAALQCARRPRSRPDGGALPCCGDNRRRRLMVVGFTVLRRPHPGGTHRQGPPPPLRWRTGPCSAAGVDRELGQPPIEADRVVDDY